MRGGIRASARVAQSAPLDRLRVVFPVGFNPTAGSGWPAPVGTIAIDAAGTVAWEKYHSAATGWFLISTLSSLVLVASTLLRTATLEYVVANDQDPSISGLAAYVGSRATCANGTKAWTKWGTGNKNWCPLHVISGTLSVAAASWSIGSLAGDSNGGFEIELDVENDGAAGVALSMLVNGATTGLQGERFNYAQLAQNSAYDLNVAGVFVTSMGVGDVAYMRISCNRPQTGGRRLIVVESNHFASVANLNQAAYLNRAIWNDTATELTSVGVAFSGAGRASINSRYKVRRFP